MSKQNFSFLPPGVAFGEATDEQRYLCDKLAAHAFGQPLSEEEYLARERFMSEQSLAQISGVRYWCLSCQNGPKDVVSTCKTVKRELLVKMTGHIRNGKGYCITSVVTHPDHRGRGFASLLLRHVAQWMDGPGEADASVLYSSKCEFYRNCGWIAKPAPALKIPVAFHENNYRSVKIWEGRSAALSKEEIAPLCERDVDALRADVENLEIGSDQSVLTVLPTSDLLAWLHARAEFMGLKTRGESPKRKGAICDSSAWILWHHDFRKQCLFIQRIRCFVDDAETRPQIFATLLLHAIREARQWQLSSVVIWEPEDTIQQGLELLQNDIGAIPFTLEGERRETISVRWRYGETKGNNAILPNEHYAWN